MGKKRNIVKIEDIIRDQKDFLTIQKTGKYEIRAKYANRNVDVPLEDKLRSDAKRRNTCICCHNEATKMVYLEIKGGGQQLERYCSSCFDQVVDAQMMVLKLLDNFLDQIIIKPSEGETRSVEDWRQYVKKWQRF